VKFLALVWILNVFCVAASKDEKAPALFVGESLVVVGTVKQGDSVDIDYLLRNDGGIPLVIERVRGQCGCTIAKLPKDRPASGESMSLKLTFTTKGWYGHQKKHVYVYSNDPRKPEAVLTFEVDVKVLYRVNPRGVLSFRNKKRAEKLETTPASSRKSASCPAVQVLSD